MIYGKLLNWMLIWFLLIGDLIVILLIWLKISVLFVNKFVFSGSWCKFFVVFFLWIRVFFNINFFGVVLEGFIFKK